MYVNARVTTRLADISQELEKEHWQKSDLKVMCSIAMTVIEQFPVAPPHLSVIYRKKVETLH